MALQIIQMALPVLFTFVLGYFCKQKQIIDAKGINGLKSLVSNITLPVVLFNAFFTADYSIKILITFATVFFSCILGLVIGFFLRRFEKPYGKFLPFLVTNFEGGMLGYALYSLLYPGMTSQFAMFDIGQTLCAFTVFLITLKTVNGEKATFSSITKNMFTNPAFVGSVLGVILGLLGVGQWVITSAVGGIVTDLIAFVAAPTSALILIIVGYELSFEKKLVKPVAKTLALRLGVMVVLLGLGSAVLFSIFPFEKSLFVALMLAYCLPAPFIIPLFVDGDEHKEYIATTLSMQTLMSIVLFVFVAAYTLM